MINCAGIVNDWFSAVDNSCVLGVQLLVFPSAQEQVINFVLKPSEINNVIELMTVGEVVWSHVTAIIYT